MIQRIDGAEVVHEQLPDLSHALRMQNSECNMSAGACPQVKYVEKLQAPNLRGKLMQKLQGDFPAVPEILGNLVPHQVNPWIGAAPEGAGHLILMLL